MKKLGILIAAAIAVALIYFFTLGSEEISAEAKAELNKELLALQHNGFKIEDRISTPKEDHFIIVFDDPKLIAPYLAKQGTRTNIEDIKALEGMKIGVDIHYMKDLYSALSMEFYPVELPRSIKNESQNDPQVQALLAQLQDMLEHKKILMHIDIKKDLRHFKGYLKDINETFIGEEKITIASKSLTFTGEVENDRLITVDQKLEQLQISGEKGFTLQLSKLISHHQSTGPSLYDLDTHYAVKSLTLSQNDILKVTAKDITVNTTEKENKGLLQSHIVSNIKEVATEADGEKSVARDLHSDISLQNIDISALEMIQSLDPEKDETKLQEAFAKLLTKELNLTVNDISVREIIENGKALGGISMTASLTIDKNSNMALAQQNPLLLLGALDATMTLKISDALFAIGAQDPRAMMLMMLIPPQEEKGHKIYTIIIKNGKTTVNGVSL